MADENTLADLRRAFPAAKELEDTELLELWQHHNNIIAAGEESDFGRLLDNELAFSPDAADPDEDDDDMGGEDNGGSDEGTEGEESSADDLIDDDAPGNTGTEPDKAA